MQPGQIAGIKSVSFSVEGRGVYGWLKAETGVHRFQRISPFDSCKRRHTSFSSVCCAPEIANDILIVLDWNDIRIDTMRSNCHAGGQHANKTESAVRFTHLPTGTVVRCDQERSQIKNKNIAEQLLKQKLYQLEIDKKNKILKVQEDSKSTNSFGSQIRNYVLDPYDLIKDLRSGFETHNIEKIMNGDLRDLLQSVLLAGKVC